MLSRRRAKQIELPLRRLAILFAVGVPALASVFAALYLTSAAQAADPLAIVIFATAAVGIAAALFIRGIAQQLTDTAELLRRFARGESYLRLEDTQRFRELRLTAAAFNDIADRVEDRESQFALVSEATGDVIWEWRAKTDTVVWTGELYKLFGVARDRFEADSTWWHERVHPQDRERVEERLSATMEGTHRRWSEEYRFRHEDGSYRWFWDRGILMRDLKDKPVRFIGCMTDISAQRQAEERIWQLANHDELTGLPNRKVFHSELNALTEAARADAPGAVLLIDIDHFKDVNDSLGHAAGDTLLRTVSARLKDSIGDRGTVFRLGGDEFGILVTRFDRRQASELARSMLGALRDPAVVGDRMVTPRATIGIVLVPDHGANADELLQNADLALYEGKRRGRHQAVLFDPHFRAALDQRIALMAEVRQAVLEGRFRPHYQPIVSLRTGAVQGVEALMRWELADGTLRTPASFLSAYDDPELALLLSGRLFECIVKDFHSWDAAGVAPSYLAINISTTFARFPNAAERILTCLAEAGIPPSRFCIELTETMLLGEHSERIGEKVRTLHAAGVRIALDDFGTGYASLTHLQKFPVDAIKIDQSFVRSIVSDTDSQAITAAVLELGRRLGKEVIAEGVETPEQAELLRAAGCRQAQGFLYARPMPPEALLEFLSDPHRVIYTPKSKAG